MLVVWEQQQVIVTGNGLDNGQWETAEVITVERGMWRSPSLEQEIVIKEISQGKCTWLFPQLRKPLFILWIFSVVLNTLNFLWLWCTKYTTGLWLWSFRPLTLCKLLTYWHSTTVCLIFCTKKPISGWRQNRIQKSFLPSLQKP